VFGYLVFIIGFIRIKKIDVCAVHKKFPHSQPVPANSLIVLLLTDSL